MKALTIRQHWAWAIVHGSKRVENRTWRPSPKMIGQRFAIHAAVRFDSPAAFDDVSEIIYGEPGRRSLDMQTSGAIIGTARLVHVVNEFDMDLGEWFGKRTQGAYCDIEWFCGPIGFILDDIVECKPFPCRGALGFWDAPAGFIDPFSSTIGGAP